MSESFLRQRRNLFLANAIIIALCVGDVQINTLTFAGVTLNAFRRPEVFIFGLWIAELYFFYRYNIYLFEDELKRMAGFFDREMQRSVWPKIMDLICKEYEAPNTKAFSFYKSIRSSDYEWHGQIYVEPESGFGRQVENVVLKIPRRKIILSEIKGLARFLLVVPVMTDYILPIILTIFTIIYCGVVVHWNGSASSLFHLL